MNIAILTRDLPPAVCGIGDQSLLLAEHLRERGHRVTLIAGSGAPAPDRVIVEGFWHANRLGELDHVLQELCPDEIVLQYTPLTFAVNGRFPNLTLERFWAGVGRERRTSLILHETYFRAWWHLPSWITGPAQKWLLKRLVRSSHRVFTASAPLLEEVRRWPGPARCALLPLGSAVPVVPGDRRALRERYGVPVSGVVLVLFGGGEGLRRMRRHADAVDAEFRRRSIPGHWLLLGGVPPDWFSFGLPVTRVGFLPAGDLSAHLQIADVFLMPHISGLCAKRSTLMAALAHGLPVVGTIGPYTDAFWQEVAGVTLVGPGGPENFARATMRLAESESLRLEHGRANRGFFETRFNWESITDTFLQSPA